MTLSDFLKILFKYLGDGKKAATFTGDLFDNAVNDNCRDLNISEDMLGRYYNGTRPLSQANASIIISNQDRNKFTKNIKKYVSSDDIRDSLCFEFEKIENKGIEILVRTLPKDTDEFCSSICEQFYNLVEDVNTGRNSDSKEISSENKGETIMNTDKNGDVKTSADSCKIDDSNNQPQYVAHIKHNVNSGSGTFNDTNISNPQTVNMGFDIKNLIKLLEATQNTNSKDNTD